MARCEILMRAFQSLLAAAMAMFAIAAAVAVLGATPGGAPRYRLVGYRGGAARSRVVVLDLCDPLPGRGGCRGPGW